LRGNLSKNKVYDVNKSIFKTSYHISEIQNQDKEKDGICLTYGERRIVYMNFCGIPLTERDYLEDLALDGKVILKRTFKEWDGLWTGLVWFRIGIVVNSF
jgi:hypothetical protein